MIKLLRKYIKGHMLIFTLMGPLCMFLEVFMDLQQPTLMSSIIDIGVATGDFSYVLNMGIRMIIFAVLGFIGGAGCSIFSSYVSINIAGKIRQDLYKKIFSLPCKKIDELETSSLVTRLTNDVAQVQSMTETSLRSLSRAPMLCIGGVIMAFMLSPKLAIILCVAMIILVLCATVIVNRAVPLYNNVQKRLDKLNVIMRENLLGVRVIKSFTLENSQFENFQQANKSFASDSVKAQGTTFLLMPIVTLIMNLSVVAVLWFGGIMFSNSEITEGKIMAFVNYLIQITNAVTMLVSFVVSVSRSRASSARIMQVIDINSQEDNSKVYKVPKNNDIEIDNVSFRYSEGEYVLKNISVKMEQNKRIGIIGSTGCGKSSLAAIIARLYDVNEGNISIGGVNIHDIPLDLLRKKVNIVMQESLLFSGTVAENLRYGKPDAPEDTLWKAARAAAAENFIQELPKKLDAPVAQRGKNFSGGQKQRLSIARSLLKSSDIIIMDDSTSAVDLITESRLQKSIRAWRNNSTLILIAQRVSTIMDCDMILVMDKGRIIAQGTHSNLIDDCEIYRSIVKSQLGEEAV